MKGPAIHAVAAIGDAADPATWSGIPARFLAAGRRFGWPVQPWRLDWPAHDWPRKAWNIEQAILRAHWGGYQYSDAFLDRAEASIPAALWAGRVLSFNQHFPRAWSVARHQGTIVYYVDAAFRSFCRPGGLADRLPESVRARACALERDNFQGAERVVTMARWAAAWVVESCGVPRERVTTILPGANLDLPPGWRPRPREGRPGRDRPLVLGFVGKDWRRKGLPFLLSVRDQLERANVRTEIRCAGFDPRELCRFDQVHCAGFLDKVAHPQAFVDFLAGCDLGCLFSSTEPLGISTLEFLRVGVPVAGFAVEGLCDTLPPGAGFRFDPAATPGQVAEAIRAGFVDEPAVARLRENAWALAGQVTWDRCVAEWQELLETGDVSAPLQLWHDDEAA